MEVLLHLGQRAMLSSTISVFLTDVAFNGHSLSVVFKSFQAAFNLSPVLLCSGFLIL